MRVVPWIGAQYYIGICYSPHFTFFIYFLFFLNEAEVMEHKRMLFFFFFSFGTFSAKAFFLEYKNIQMV